MVPTRITSQQVVAALLIVAMLEYAEGFFAPVLAVLSPWPAVTAALWVIIGLFGLWLGLLGIAMATGLAMALRSNIEIPEEYWRSLVDYPVR